MARAVLGLGGVVFDGRNENPHRVVLIAVAGYLLAHGAWMLRRGRTLGKALLAVGVVQAGTGAPAGVLRMLVRAPFFLLWYVPFTVVPVLDALFVLGPCRRCLHDRVAGTMVVRA